MSSKPRTIDNLGIDASIRYAKDQQLFESHLIEETRLVPQKAEIFSSGPFVPSEFDKQFPADLKSTSSWASFSAPPQELVAGKLLFSYQMIPSLGTFEELSADTDKLEAIEDLLKKPQKKKRKQSAKEKEEEEAEVNRLMALFRCLHAFDKILSQINGRRNQYHRG